jgi:hypothetical protein
MTDVVSSADVTTLGDPIYQGEGKWFKFTFTVDGVAYDLSGSTYAFSVKEQLSDAAYIYQAAAEAIDSSLEASGIIRVCLPSTSTSAMEGTYWGELTTTVIAFTNVDKKLIKFKVKQAVTP